MIIRVLPQEGKVDYWAPGVIVLVSLAWKLVRYNAPNEYRWAILIIQLADFNRPANPFFTYAVAIAL